MIASEPDGPDRQRRWKRPTAATVILLVLVVCVVLALRHDFWNWRSPGPLLWFLPVGLWWQGMVSILAAGMMWLMVRLAWPGWLEDEAIEAERRRLEGQRHTPNASE